MFDNDEKNYLNTNVNDETTRVNFLDSLKFQLVVSKNQKDAFSFYADFYKKIESMTEEEWQKEVISQIPFSTQYNAFDNEENIREYGDSVLLEAIS